MDATTVATRRRRVTQAEVEQAARRLAARLEALVLALRQDQDRPA